MELKPLHRDAIESALAKAERYRLLNEPSEAESICLDILDVEPDNQQAQIMLLLALSDQFAENPAAGPRAERIADQLHAPYERAYYRGLIAERRAKAHLHRTGASTDGIYEWVREALRYFAEAESLRPHGNDDAILRWNACIRMLKRYPTLQPEPEHREPQFLE
jgi:hypothetical protein